MKPPWNGIEGACAEDTISGSPKTRRCGPYWPQYGRLWITIACTVRADGV